MSLIAAATALLPTITGLLDKLIADPEAKAQAQLELLKLQQSGAFKDLDAALQVNLAQAKINEVEAASQSGFQAGWRPLAGYVCVAGLGYEFLLRPLLPWLLTVAGAADVPPLPSLSDVLFELIFGMLGLGTLRSADRWNRMNAIAPK
ncbi:3TM-type holin [Azotobacter beijerinckii]|uniref:Holin of 3TMs, for gene-transfer release n=1 Tax=Azotobacter beijerinckii TaxID=170623 RepID=A0A1I3ZN49_9GAMM|nr:3TM-type holin [Azotobacter beijerinckii]SFB58826.1 Holin of 3TMs, for gene-transfer release [Azotobacter beijerinckii]SFK44969.1 Holin of 3TMs, for gene-transfer release [Azotobacter beijerinckii]